MKKDQSGFGAAEILVIVLIVVILGLVGVVAWKSTSNKDQSQLKTSSGSGDATKMNQKDAQKADVSIHDVDISLQSESDLSKLPSYTPSSFKTYLQNILKDNKRSVSNVDGCDSINQYLIKRISQVNISGGVEVVDENGQGCAGGAPAIWVLTPKGSWDQETLNGVPCVSENGGFIYAEFATECSTDTGTASLVANPNGSITLLTR